jgi:hypothetical protein
MWVSCWAGMRACGSDGAVATALTDVHPSSFHHDFALPLDRSLSPPLCPRDQPDLRRTTYLRAKASLPRTLTSQVISSEGIAERLGLAAFFPVMVVLKRLVDSFRDSSPRIQIHPEPPGSFVSRRDFPRHSSKPD